MQNLQSISYIYIYALFIQIANKKHDLKKKLRVVFANEPGLDLGGLTKEWFLLLIRKIFREEYGMYCDLIIHRYR